MVGVIIIWILSNLPLGVVSASQESLLGMIGTAVAPIFTPLGFGTWQAAVAILAGLIAKEVIVGTFASLGSLEGDDGTDSLLHDSFTPLSSYSFMVFSLLYIPCFATLATIRQETSSWKWPLIICAISLVTAYVVAFLIYNVGLLLGFA